MFGRKKYEDDYYQDEDENGLGGSFIPPMKLDLRDGFIAVFLGVFAALFIWAFSYKGLHPEAWSDCAIAAGLRPATTLFPGLWRLLARGIYSTLGIAHGDYAIMILGKVFVGAMVAYVYLLSRESLAVLVRMHDDNGVWWGRLSRWISALAALLFLCADPVWRLGQAFTPMTLLAFEFVLAAYLLARFLGSGTVRPVYYAMFVIGLFGAESPLGLAMLVGFWSIFYLLLNKGQLFHVQLLEPLLQQSSKWLITLLWAFGLFLGITLNVVGFISFDGLAATGATAGTLPLMYAVEMWHVFAGAASAGGWIVGLGFMVLPFILAVALLRRATDLEYFLSYHVGIVFFVIVTAVLMLLLIPFAPQIARLLKAPADAFAGTVTYVRLCSAGALFIVAYNLLGSVFRGIGDSKIPLLAVAIACAVNIGGDLLLVAVFRMGVAGTAIATALENPVAY